MKVLLVGGSGHVGSFITPYLRPHHELRVLDVAPPKHTDLEYVEGSVTDPAALRRALEGVDTFIWLVMKGAQGGSVTNQDIPTIMSNYDVNNKGLHLLLFIAQEMGIKNGVVTSSMSVHYRKREKYPAEELVPLDTPSVYGLTKGFGELICQYFARWFEMNLIALRITGPRTRVQWLEERRNPRVYPDGSRLFVTDEEDLADAYLRAIDAVQVGHGRFDAIFIADDENEKEHNLSKAKRVLGWEPRAHRLLES
ncbi:MAG: NAD(P)-dependent oxidoreductase [Chloroflexi bacterium]|nr:NAD(P)-dependent oxidoreductase [Chloroflexota bacterium]